MISGVTPRFPLVPPLPSRNPALIEEPGAVRLDEALGAWVVSRYDDVAAALRDTALIIPGTQASNDSSRVANAFARTEAHRAVRHASSVALSHDRIDAWSAEMRSSAERMLGALRASTREAQPIDLAAAFVRPWSHALAMSVNGISTDPTNEDDLIALAREIFLAAACTTDADAPSTAAGATTALARRLSSADSVIGVQSFVALTHTLPCALASAWDVLLRHDDVMDRLRTTPSMISAATDELLRLASPSRAVFRRAAVETTVCEQHIPTGARVILMLASANRDPLHFPQPDRFDVNRNSTGHLGFGRGTHHCAGAQLILSAVTIATSALLNTVDAMIPAGDVTMLGGFAIAGVDALPVTLTFTNLEPHA